MANPVGRPAHITDREERCQEAHAKMVARYITLRDHIVKHLGCRNCGEPAGYECRHDYGCIDADRCVPADEMARDAPSEGRRQPSVGELTAR
jgi:hypothetical protein